MKINLNDVCWVKLTPVGRQMFESWYGKMLDDRRRRFQLWELMAVFGSGMRPSSDGQMFQDNVIEFEELRGARELEAGWYWLAGYGRVPQVVYKCVGDEFQHVGTDRVSRSSDFDGHIVTFIRIEGPK